MTHTKADIIRVIVGSLENEGFIVDDYGVDKHGFLYYTVYGNDVLHATSEHVRNNVLRWTYGIEPAAEIVRIEKEYQPKISTATHLFKIKQYGISLETARIGCNWDGHVEGEHA